MSNIKKIAEYTYGTHVYMKLLIDEKEYEIDWYAGLDCSWKHYITTADGTEDREKVIAAFKKLY